MWMGVAGWYEKGINLELRSMIYEQTRLRYGDDRRGRRRVMTELSPDTSPDPAEPDSPNPRSNLLKVDRPMTRSEVKELWGDAYTASCKTIDWFLKKQDRFFLFIP